MASTAAPVVEEFVGVYDADGGVRGEAAYVIGKMLGTAHCGLCDITHSPLRRKPDWDAMTAELRVPFTLLHRNERSPQVERATVGADRLPAVLARVRGEEELRYLLGPGSLDALGGSIDAFAARLLEAVDEAGLGLGEPAAA